MKVNFCFQSRGGNDHYNLAVYDVHGNNHYIVDDDPKVIEKELKVFWGHLLEEKTQSVKPKKKVIKKMPSMPMPAGFPMPS